MIGLPTPKLFDLDDLAEIEPLYWLGASFQGACEAVFKCQWGLQWLLILPPLMQTIL